MVKVKSAVGFGKTSNDLNIESTHPRELETRRDIGHSQAHLVAGLNISCTCFGNSPDRVCDPAGPSFDCRVLLWYIRSHGTGMGARLAENQFLPMLAFCIWGAGGDNGRNCDRTTQPHGLRYHRLDLRDAARHRHNPRGRSNLRLTTTLHIRDSSGVQWIEEPNRYACLFHYLRLRGIQKKMENCCYYFVGISFGRCRKRASINIDYLSRRNGRNGKARGRPGCWEFCARQRHPKPASLHSSFYWSIHPWPNHQRG